MKLNKKNFKPSRCRICGLKASGQDWFIDKKYSVEPDGKVICCKNCFNLWMEELYTVLEKRIKDKLLGKRIGTPNKSIGENKNG